MLVRFGTLIAIMLLVVSGSPADNPMSERTDALDLLILGKEPQRLELRVQIDGRAIDSIWDDTFARLHAFFDRDDNHVLDRIEAARLPSEWMLRQTLWGQFSADVSKPLPFAELDANGDGKVSPSELADYYRQAGLGTVIVGVGQPLMIDDLTRALLKAFDRNHDQVVSPTEWANAADLLLGLDRDDDELIGPGELVERIAYPGSTGALRLSAPQPQTPPHPVLDALPLLVLPARLSDTHWQTVLHQRSEREQRPLIDSSKLRRQPATVVRTMTFDRGATAEQRWANEFAGVPVHLRADEGKLSEQWDTAKQRYLGWFIDTDANGDGALDAKELTGPKAGPLKSVGASADRDGDERLQRAELDAWLILQEQVVRGQVLLSVIDFGQGLFEAIDRDHDGSLSIRELRQCATHLKSLGALTDRGIDRAKLPRSLWMVISRGQPRSLLGSPNRAGPAWFSAMDRNRDGDLSAKEWVGPLEWFTRLDIDRDGLLSATEAEKMPMNK